MWMWAFCCFCCYWTPLLLHSDLIEGMGLVQSSYIYWALSCVRLHDQFWRRYHEVLRKRYILLLWDEKFSLYISAKSNWSKASINFTVSLLSFCFPDRPIGESGVLKSPTIIVLDFYGIFGIWDSFFYLLYSVVDICVYGPWFLPKVFYHQSCLPLCFLSCFYFCF